MIKLERDNLHMFCRTCLERLQSSCDTSEKNESTENYDIREAPELTKLLIICTTLNINEDVDAVYPQRVCSKCYRTLQDFKQFREMAIKSGEVLRGIVENSDGVLIAENAEAEKHLTSKPDSQASDDFGSNFEVSQTDMSDPFYNMYENEAEHDAQASRSKEIKVESAMDEDDSLILYENQADSAAENEADASAGEVFPSTSKAAIKRKRVDDADDGERFPCTFEGCKAVFTTNKSLQAHWKENHDTDMKSSHDWYALRSCATPKKSFDALSPYKKRTNNKQFRLMVELLKKCPDIARGIPRPHSQSIVFWKNVETKLNSLGPPFKDVIGWKKVWTDYKFQIKKKIKAIECGNYQKEVRLSNLEVEVNRLVNKNLVHKSHSGIIEADPIEMAEDELSTIDTELGVLGYKEQDTKVVDSNHGRKAASERIKMRENLRNLLLGERILEETTTKTASTSCGMTSKVVPNAIQNREPLVIIEELEDPHKLQATKKAPHAVANYKDEKIHSIVKGEELPHSSTIITLLQKQLEVQEALLEKISVGFEIMKEQHCVGLAGKLENMLVKMNENNKAKIVLMEESNAEQRRHNSVMKEIAMEKLKIEKATLEIKTEKLESLKK